MLKEFSVVKLKIDVPKYGLKKGTEGAIVDIVHAKDGDVYTVDCVDEQGEPLEDSIWPYFKEDELELICEYPGGGHG